MRFELISLLFRAVRGIPSAPRGHAAREAYEVGNRSLVFIGIVMGLTGAIMVTHAAAQAQRVVGDLTIVGPAFLQLLLREFAPVIVALMLAARYGAGVAAEIGAMRVTDQIDALRLVGVDPAAYLVAPRIVAGLVATVPLVLAGAAVAFGAGGIAAHLRFGVGWESYFSLRWVGMEDVAIAAAKSLSFGIAVPLVAARAGLAARGGAPGVGLATTRAVIGSSVAVLILDLIIGSIGHLILMGAA